MECAPSLERAPPFAALPADRKTAVADMVRKIVDHVADAAHTGHDGRDDGAFDDTAVAVRETAIADAVRRLVDHVANSAVAETAPSQPRALNRSTNRMDRYFSYVSSSSSSSTSNSHTHTHAHTQCSLCRATMCLKSAPVVAFQRQYRLPLLAAGSQRAAPRPRGARAVRCRA